MKSFKTILFAFFSFFLVVLLQSCLEKRFDVNALSQEDKERLYLPGYEYEDSIMSINLSDGNFDIEEYELGSLSDFYLGTKESNISKKYLYDTKCAPDGRALVQDFSHGGTIYYAVYVNARGVSLGGSVLKAYIDNLIDQNILDMRSVEGYDDMTRKDKIVSLFLKLVQAKYLPSLIQGATVTCNDETYHIVGVKTKIDDNDK